MEYVLLIINLFSGQMETISFQDARACAYAEEQLVFEAPSMNTICFQTFTRITKICSDPPNIVCYFENEHGERIE